MNLGKEREKKRKRIIIVTKEITGLDIVYMTI